MRIFPPLAFSLQLSAFRWLAILSFSCAVIVQGSGSTNTAAPAQSDWYFRETLVAIRDWELILGAWEKATPESERQFTFPVPQNGKSVEWPNPIPLKLLPVTDVQRHLGLRLRDGKVDLSRTTGPAQASSETLMPGKEVVGYWHPGGGAKDRWYHQYHRRFDRAGTFLPKPAPFALHIPAPLDFRRGLNHHEIKIRNTEDRAQDMVLQVSCYYPDQPAVTNEMRITLAPQAERVLPLQVELKNEGGALVLLNIQVNNTRFRIPFLAHAENVRAVLSSLEQILTDRPDPLGSAALASLRRRAEEWSMNVSESGDAWSRLFTEASSWRERLLLNRIAFDTLFFVERQPFDSEQPYMDAHHLHNPPGGSLCRLSPVRPDGVVTPVVDSLGEGIYRDLCLHWNAQKLLFSFGNGSDLWDGSESYHLYESDPDGSHLRQLTQGPKNDCEPFYLPNGQIGFTSDRSEHFVMCGAARHVANLFLMEADGSHLRQLSYNVFNEFNPSVLPDGRIIYSRWEYNERSVTSMHNPFTIYPDGTMVSTYFGNAGIRPNVFMFTRPVPQSDKVMALFTAHHGQTHGPIGLIDRNAAVNGPLGFKILTPHIPITGEKAEDSQYGWYSDPVPLSEDTYLCAYTPTVVPWLSNSWGIYLGDRHGNLALVYRDCLISCAEPVPLVQRPVPPIVQQLPFNGAAAHGPSDEDRPPSQNEDAFAETATLFLADVSVGLTGIARTEPRYLRIIEDVPRKSVHDGGVVITAGSSIYTVKRILGTVPIELDGSAHFSVPANRNVYFEVLDKNQLEIQRMRSVVCLKPGERRSCVGCHESPYQTAFNKPVAALRRPPSQPTPPPWGSSIFSFLRDVQPVLNARCVPCHTYDRPQNGIILTDDLTDRFTIAYEELLPFVKVANAMRWDQPEDVLAQPPYTYGSKSSRLIQILDQGHHEVRLSPEERLRLVNWVDANAVYYDRYESAYGDLRSIFSGSTAKTLSGVYTRRCASCHGDGDGRADTWWLTINRRDISLNRALKAPLARPAGGWGRCEGTVFANTDDADYQTLRSAFSRLQDRLARQPREDLASIKNTAAERQKVNYPAPPSPRVALPSQPADGNWAYLTELPWHKATSGWTPNGDGLPRKDRDVENHPLRILNRTYRRGIGTHAPSDLRFRLDGAYDRFCCQIGAVESPGTVVFQIYTDDKLVFESAVLRGPSDAKSVDIPVSGAHLLRLQVTDAGDGITGDMANWADAKLRRIGSH